MVKRLRRAVPRQPVGWSATYRFDNIVNEPWRRSRILDISPVGAGLELYQVLPDEHLGGRIIVSLKLRGEGRNVVRGEDGTTARFGIQFPEPTDAAEQYLNVVDAKNSGSR